MKDSSQAARRMQMENANEPITVIITRLVSAGNESAFEDAVKAFIPKALVFPGHLGVHMLRPSSGVREYGAVLKFRSHLDWDAFRNSAEYLAFFAQVAPFLEGPQHEETLCGLESWFTPMGERMTRVPPRWKMALITWIGVCLVVYAVNIGLWWWTYDWLGWLRFLVANAVVVVVLTWAVMPILNRLFRPWLHSSE
jgi:antibiotic biosynthesis monooxygenase (ABM) superfamily enzyme